MIRMAEGSDPHGTQLRFIHGEAEELPFDDGSFDLVLSTVSFHHWMDQDKGLREIERVLVPGGDFILADHFVTRGIRPFFIGRGRDERFRSQTEIDVMLAECRVFGS